MFLLKLDQINKRFKKKKYRSRIDQAEKECFGLCDILIT